ncbi:MAG: Dyp-type peroxidase [Propionicimonas sp.]|uniref:Dyp-type peroxidase n=1 Tax=Propionicimonas sp. TaxID=1955623 RepID=UPI003D0BAC22
MLGRPENLPRRRTEPPRFDLSDIQGNVLRGYTLPACAYVFVRILDIGKACRLLERTLSMVMTAEPWDAPPDRALNVAVGYSALVKLGLDPTVLASFPEVFRDGMASRAERLGDLGPSAPEGWEIPDFDFMVTVYAKDLETLKGALDEVIATDVEGGVDPVYIQLAQDRPTGQDHFGNFDGVSQPALAGSGVLGRPGDGQPDGAGGWRDVAVGEVLLGYEDEDGTLPAAPAEPFDRNGTFVVVRKLRMDVAAYRRFLEDAHFPGGPDLLAAKLLGRWPDGTPLASSASRPDPALVADPARINNFHYESDPVGLACPAGSHIRRTNPRDSKGFFDGRLTNRHRIVRRGRAYGDPLAAGSTEDDGVDRGLMFVCFQADIWRQFETIQALWVNDGNPFGIGADKDPLIGEHHASAGKLTIPGHPPFFVKPLPTFVTLRGGGYLFQPSISALRYMASLA